MIGVKGPGFAASAGVYSSSSSADPVSIASDRGEEIGDDAIGEELLSPPQPRVSSSSSSERLRRLSVSMLT